MHGETIKIMKDITLSEITKRPLIKEFTAPDGILNKLSSPK
jgi:hypothetical protein